MNQITDPRHLLPPPDNAAPPAAKTRPAGRGRYMLLAGAAVMAAGLVGWGAWQHLAAGRRAADAQAAAQDYAPTVRVTEAKKQDGPVKVVLPGATAPFDSARLFARATGYIGERRVDIGSRVKKGDLLLKISAPDLDAQLAQAAAQLGQTKAALVQAQANLESARSNVDLARVTNQRTSTLASQGWETRQNADNSKANVSAGSAGVDSAQAGITVAEANIAAQAATVQRLQALVAYENVQAPIDGVITARTVDTGDLVNADTGGDTALLTIQNDDVLRVSVYVPQSDAVPLRDGLYVQVSLSVPRTSPAVVVPDEAIILGAGGPHVAVVEGDRIRLKPIEIARDFGTSAELRHGLEGGEQVVLSAPTGIADGAKVKVQPPDPPKGQDGAKKGTS